MFVSQAILPWPAASKCGISRRRAENSQTTQPKPNNLSVRCTISASEYISIINNSLILMQSGAVTCHRTAAAHVTPAVITLQGRLKPFADGK